MGFVELLQKSWPILLSILGVVIWLVRLEGRVNYNERELVELKIKHDNLDSELMKEMSQIKTALARIEGRLEGLHGQTSKKEN